MEIGFFNETNKPVPHIEELEKLMEFAVKKEGLNNVEFNLIFVDNPMIHSINKQYRNIDKETDVITFALEDSKDIEYEDIRVLGDIYISIDKAEGQALEYGHSLLRELAFLSIHGFYHLLGYDHNTKDEELVMFKKQEEVLDEYGIKKENN